MDALSKLRVIVVKIPESCTSQAQILDVGVNKPFKNLMCRFRYCYLVDNPDATVTRELVGKWIADSWENLNGDIVINTTRHIGFYDQEAAIKLKEVKNKD